MKHIIIGTAGHIDHGKTTLIKALTGRNTDRWEEERRRGITIDLGFTWFDLPRGDRAGIIDVPGHEKFINNMVAGVVGMDLVLLVIAADEGIMPQTREHMDILHLLGVQNSIIVLNKCDLVDEEWITLVEDDIRDELKDTFLNKAPILRVSASTGEGLESLVAEIEKMTENEVEEKDVTTVPRLPIDRVFSMAGFGTVITGTLVSGTIRKEDTLEMYPIEKICKIRSIQVHGEDKQECYAGQRVAINLSNVKKSEISRGCVLASPGNMKKTDLLDVKLEVLKTSKRVLENNSRLHFFSGTSEILCRASLLDQDSIGPGDSGYVQLRLESETAVRRGDRFVVRFYSPMETIGGGVVIEPNPTFKKRFREEVIDELKRKEEGSSADVIEMHIKNNKDTLITLSELGKISVLSKEEVEKDIEELKEDGRIKIYELRKETYVWHVDSEQEALKKLNAEMEKYEKQHPYRYGMKKAEAQGICFKKMKPIVFDRVIDGFVAEEKIGRQDEYIFTTGFSIDKDQKYREAENLLIGTFEKAKYDFVRQSEIPPGTVSREVADDVLNILISEKEVVRVQDDMLTLKRYMDEAERIVREKLKADPVITIAEVRDIFSTSRKSAKPILEYMDDIKVTRKTGGESERVAYQ